MISRRKRELHKEMIDILYSPDFGFYKRFLNPDVFKMFQ
jgi:hypothetical protein